MFRKRKIKLYLHDATYIKVTSFRRKLFSFSRILSFTFEIIFEVCYIFGVWIYNLFKHLVNRFIRELIKTKANCVKKISKFQANNPFGNIGLLFFGLLLSSLFLVTVYGAGNISSTFEKIFRLGTKGKESLEQAKSDIGQDNFQAAESNLAKASYFFSNAQKEFTYLDLKTRSLLNILPIHKEAEKILALGTIFSETGTELVSMGQKVSSIQIMSSGLFTNSNENFSETLNSIEKSFFRIQDNIDKAENIYNSLTIAVYPTELKNELKILEQKIAQIKTGMVSARHIFFALRSLFENNDKILIIFQNNNELRPTGGFMGTIAELKMKNGQIQNLNVESVYEKDGQLKEYILPPHPIMNVNPRWFLRDSNWFVDFTQSAEKVLDFYEKEGGETPKALIMITPKLITDLLDYTGPVFMEKYNVTLTSENFVEIAQIGTSASENSPENKPKQFLADLIPVLLSKISENKSDQKTKLLVILQKNLSERNIQFFSPDKSLQDTFQLLGWSGNILPTKKDYLGIFSSNLEGTKTDLFIKQEVELISTIHNNGEVVNTLVISRENRLPKIAKTYNNSFIRILVPKGSVLLSNEGFDYKILDTKLLENKTTDQMAADWEIGIVRDLSTGTIIGSEANKTFFGNWLKVEGGEKKTVKLSYRLPFKVEKNKQYSLIVQKQAGATNDNFTYSIKSDSFEPVFSTKDLPSAKNSEIRYNFVLDSDKFFGFIFRKIE